MRDDQTLTRGEIAVMLKVTTRTVANCERVLGLDKAKIRPTRQTVRYSVQDLLKQQWFKKLWR